MTITMYDAVNVNNIPADAPAVAGYINGAYPNYEELVSRFPRAKHVSIAVNTSGRADFLDVERGDASPGQAVPWLDAMLRDGVDRPGVYASTSTWFDDGLFNDMSHFGSKVRRWIAEWTFHDHLPNGFDCCQWSGGMVLDIDVCADNFFGPAGPPPPPPPPPDPNHYLWFSTGPFSPPSNHKGWGNLNERQIVEQYDGARMHPVKYNLYLKNSLELKLRYLADRVAYQAIKGDPHKDGKPSWDQFNRGWRYQALIHRAEGNQVVK